ncbi:hypothetical protein LguiB_004447 [Lonicera macranthoides]
MAYCILSVFHISTIPRLSLPPSPSQPSIRATISGPKFLQSAKCMAIATPTDDQTIARRVGNYHPPIWEYDYVQSLTSKYQGDNYTRRANELKEEVRMMLNDQVEDPVRKLELIDTLQRIGVYYHFEVEIKRILESINDNYYSSSDMRRNEEDLYATALKFRLLRQYGYHVPQVEAKWYHNGYTPTLEEYLENAWISISGPTILMHAYFFVSNHHSKDALECPEKYSNLIRWSSIILRLGDDLGTSQDEIKRGDNPKSIQCYMRETGASEEKAREHIHYLISDTWKKMNGDRVVEDSPFNQIFVQTALNMARMGQCMYQHGDGHGNEYVDTKDRVISLIIEPISLV